MLLFHGIILMRMSKINLLLTDANNNLSKVKGSILAAVKRVESITLNDLDIKKDVNVLITNRAPMMIIKEDGIGGFTYSSDFIFLAINEEKVKEEFIFEMLSHEMCHAKRLSVKPEYPKTLLEAIINEGLATFYESEISRNNQDRQFFIKCIEKRTREENLKILKYCTPHLDDTKYDDGVFFFRGNKDIPRWSGYSLGREIIKEFIEVRGITLLDALSINYDIIVDFVKDEMAQI